MSEVTKQINKGKQELVLEGVSGSAGAGISARLERTTLARAWQANDEFTVHVALSQTLGTESRAVAGRVVPWCRKRGGRKRRRRAGQQTGLQAVYVNDVLLVATDRPWPIGLLFESRWGSHCLLTRPQWSCVWNL
jgi:hypothetical protein